MAPNLNRIGTPFLILQQVDSTNNYATALVHEGMAEHGTVVFTYHQTKGKGQRNNQWFAVKNQNITLSVILKPNLPPSSMFYLSMAVALAAKRFMRRYTDPVYVKWPNDIIISDRKAGGILIENILSGYEWKFAIAGIGLNLNQTEFPGLKATSIIIETGIELNILDASKQLVSELHQSYTELIQDPESIRTEYLGCLYKKGSNVKLKKQNRNFEARIIGVTPEGKLIVHHVFQEEFSIGEIEWMY